MKTLINKHNSAIRITSPEITTAHPPVSNEGYVYWIPAINQMYSPIDWTLVEEESVDLDAIVNNVFDKYSFVDGYGQLVVSFNRAELYSFLNKIARKEE